MTDKELLELAAKAAGFVPHHSYREKTNSLLWLSESGFPATWSPLTDDKDALRLAVKLHLIIDFGLFDCVEKVRAGRLMGEKCLEELGQDPYAATRRAIVRAAAEIGGRL